MRSIIHNRKLLRASVVSLALGSLMVAFTNCSLVQAECAGSECSSQSGVAQNSISQIPTPSPGPTPSPSPNPNPNPQPLPAPTPSTPPPPAPSTTNQAYIGIMAKDFNSQQGTQLENDWVSHLDNDDWIMFRNVVIETGTTFMYVQTAVPPEYANGMLEVHLDSPQGELIGAFQIPSSGDWNKFVTNGFPLAPASGTHDLYIVFKGTSGIGNIRSFALAK